MIARNFIRFPGALLAQRELELVIAATETLTKAGSILMAKSMAANVAWVCELVTKQAKKVIPAWFASMKKRAKELAKKVKQACMHIFQ